MKLPQKCLAKNIKQYGMEYLVLGWYTWYWKGVFDIFNQQTSALWVKQCNYKKSKVCESSQK